MRHEEEEVNQIVKLVTDLNELLRYVATFPVTIGFVDIHVNRVLIDDNSEQLLGHIFLDRDAQRFVYQANTIEREKI